MKLLSKLTEKTPFFIQIFQYKFVDFSQSMKVISESLDLLKINERSPIIRLTEEFLYYNQIDTLKVNLHMKDILCYYFYFLEKEIYL